MIFGFMVKSNRNLDLTEFHSKVSGIEDHGTIKLFPYFMHKMSWPILCNTLINKIGQDF